MRPQKLCCHYAAKRGATGGGREVGGRTGDPFFSWWASHLAVKACHRPSTPAPPPPASPRPEPPGSPTHVSISNHRVPKSHIPHPACLHPHSPPHPHVLKPRNPHIPYPASPNPRLWAWLDQAMKGVPRGGAAASAVAAQRHLVGKWQIAARRKRSGPCPQVRVHGFRLFAPLGRWTMAQGPSISGRLVMEGAAPIGTLGE